MYKKILVATDMSPLGKQVFAHGLSVAKMCNSKMMVLHVLSAQEENIHFPVPVDLFEVYPTLGNDLTLETWHQQWEEFVQAGLELVRGEAQQAQAQGVTAEYNQISGSPETAICKLAKDWQADLIVLGRRGVSGLTEFFLGSVSNYVLHHAPCSVLIVQHLES